MNERSADDYLQTVFLESHDAARAVSRFGDGTLENRFEVAKMLALLETTLGGTLFMHQGQEIGMANLASDIRIEEYKDIETKGFLHDLQQLRQATEPNRQVEMAEIVAEVSDQVRLKARDHGRMPMPWDHNAPHAGFSESRPWTRMNTDSNVCNVADQEHLPNSVLNFWRQLLVFRRAYADTLIFGDFEPVAIDNGPIFAYHRTAIAGQELAAPRMLVILNLTQHDGIEFSFPTGLDGSSLDYSILLSARSKRQGSCVGTKYKSGTRLRMGAYEGLILAY